ncbi:MAG: FAD synthase [Bacilli bacterium]|nr:FAD synthase [Bacilli bacterium]
MKKKYKIGYTTGVFDMFHIGHLNLLKQAKKMCDYLIVGVSTDENVMNYKGKTPIITFKDRAEIVKSIKYVDEVVPQQNMDKFQMWEKLKFDVLFHGDDWKNSDMYNDLIDKFKSVNVDVVFLKHTDGISSTELIKKCQSK